jgi:hypothetical protein
VKQISNEFRCSSLSSLSTQVELAQRCYDLGEQSDSPLEILISLEEEFGTLDDINLDELL